MIKLVLKREFDEFIMQPAVCELDKCGVLAVGRCTECQQAFCTSHQAFVRGTILINQCIVCRETSENKLNAARALKNAYEPALRNRIKKIARAMADANVTGRVPRRRWKGSKKGGWFRQSEDIWEECAPAWPIYKVSSDKSFLSTFEQFWLFSQWYNDRSN